MVSCITCLLVLFCFVMYQTSFGLFNRYIHDVTEVTYDDEEG